MSDELLRAIESSRRHMERLVRFYDHAAAFEKKNIDESKYYERQSQRSKNRLDFFNATIDKIFDPKLCKHFKLTPMFFSSVTSDELIKANNRISHTRKRIYKTIAIEQAARLRSMGLSDDEITFMKEHGTSPKRDGVRIDLSVEHIIPMNVSGNSEIENLHIIPRYLNNFFAWFSEIQRNGRDEGSIVTIEARHDGSEEQPYIPLIPGGFRPQIGTRDSLKARTEELLGIEMPL